MYIKYNIYTKEEQGSKGGNNGGNNNGGADDHQTYGIPCPK